MRNLTIIVLSCSLALLAAGSHAAPAARCTPAPWDPVWTVRELPAEVQTILHATVEIADAGADFNATDLLRDGLPRRRLIVGVIGNDCVHVSVEMGGRGLTRYRQVFQRIDAHWQLVDVENLEPPPRQYLDWVRRANLPPATVR